MCDISEIGDLFKSLSLQNKTLILWYISISKLKLGISISLKTVFQHLKNK